MQSRVRIIPWLEGRCSLYAVERGGLCLVDTFLDELQDFEPLHAESLQTFFEFVVRESAIRQQYLRPERPDLGVFAMYNHRELGSQYNPSRLLCSYASNSSRVMILGSGFIKQKDESIQRNISANSEAMFLGQITTELNARITAGEILVVGSELLARYHDSFEF